MITKHRVTLRMMLRPTTTKVMVVGDRKTAVLLLILIPVMVIGVILIGITGVGIMAGTTATTIGTGAGDGIPGTGAGTTGDTTTRFGMAVITAGVILGVMAT